MFSCEFCEISKSTFFTEHLWTTASPSKFEPVHALLEGDSLSGTVSSYNLFAALTDE